MGSLRLWCTLEYNLSLKLSKLYTRITAGEAEKLTVSVANKSKNFVSEQDKSEELSLRATVTLHGYPRVTMTPLSFAMLLVIYKTSGGMKRVSSILKEKI